MEEQIEHPVTTEPDPPTQQAMKQTRSPLLTYILILIVGFFIGMFFQDRFKGVKEEELSLPTPTSTPIVESTPTPTFESLMSEAITASPTPTANKLRSSVCPVQFTVPQGRVYVSKKGQYGTWQLRESNERFFFLPRSEEINGRKVYAELRLENQQYYDGEAQIVVQCQDNQNHWSQDDFFSYVLKADVIKDPLLTKVSLWNRSVGKLVYTTTYDGSKDTVWLLSTPTTLFHAKTVVFDEAFRKDTENIFNTLLFY